MYQNANLDVGIFRKLFFMVLSPIVVMANYLFTTITGSLLLSKRETLEYTLKHRVFRVIALLVVSATVYVIKEWLFDGEQLNISNMLYYSLKLNKKGAFWYL